MTEADKKRRTIRIIVESTAGMGKSTVARFLSDAFDLVGVKHRIDDDDVLQGPIKDTSKAAQQRARVHQLVGDTNRPVDDDQRRFVVIETRSTRRSRR
jgi:adenylate kinase family enzyme